MTPISFASHRFPLDVIRHAVCSIYGNVTDTVTPCDSDDWVEGDSHLLRSPPNPPDVIRQAVWVHLRRRVSYRDVEELLVERGLDLWYETVRRCVLKFGLQYARRSYHGER